jgi:hypothetical protein
MARGRFLKDVLVPLLATRLPQLDDHVAERFRSMCDRYGLDLPAKAGGDRTRPGA